MAPGFNSQYPNGQIWDDTTRCFIDALHAADDPDDGVAIAHSCAVRVFVAPSFPG
ncbi:MAG: hypothetical protein R2857_02595 [Vampirovibrionales bacterium]